MASISKDLLEVKLGFLEEVDNRLLSSHFFPSKVGGKPSWLSLNPLPETEDLLCTECQAVLRFLLQIYAPLKLKPDTFHRSLYIFLCVNPLCKTFKILRSQLPLNNDFYSSLPPSEDITNDFDPCEHPRAEKFHNLCFVCGIKGTKSCSRCKKANYCSKNHQIVDWKAFHKKECSELLKERDSNNSSEQTLATRLQRLGFEYQTEVFKELELVTEDEEAPDELNSKSEDERLQEYRDLVALPEFRDNKLTLDDLERSATAETEDDKVYLRFKERIKPEPTQVLRYSRNGSPLWVSAYQKPQQEEIPTCQLCGAQRVFEFQVMPQMLNHLDLDRLDSSVDWGTLCIYTCEDSCSIGNLYAPEFIWRQDFHNPDK